MKYYCALCFDEQRPGLIPDGGGIPLCPEHAARSRQSARKPPAPVVVGLQSPYELECIRRALTGTGTSMLSLGDIARPNGTTLQ
jgi:hypothetical protein